MCGLIDDPGGGVAGLSDHGMYDIRTLNVTRGHVQNVCNTRAYKHHCLSSHTYHAKKQRAYRLHRDWRLKQ